MPYKQFFLEIIFEYYFEIQYDSTHEKHAKD